MKYSDGRDVKVGDKVKLDYYDDSTGIVVCSMDTGEYTEEYPESAWSYLGKGVMIEAPKYGLVHYKEPDEDLQLISRTSKHNN